ncbi:MAG: FAD:protein FMN transferase [Clostridiales bacterium]|nr:FAD:protein FMN transferase [Clostridiales bacterium]
MKTKVKFLLTTLSVLALSVSSLFTTVALAEQSGDDSVVDSKTYTVNGFDGYVFNTLYTATVAADFTNEDKVQSFNDLREEIISYIDSVESSISTNVESSSVYAFNQANAGERVEIDKIAYEILTLAKNMCEFTEGYYNPAVYYSVDLYGFAPRSEGQTAPYDRQGGASTALPEAKYITAFQQLSQCFNQVVIEELEGKYYATKPQNAFVQVDGVTYSLKVDLGGIGKGYIVDEVNNMYDKYGFDYGYFTFGSSSIFVNKFYNNDEKTFNLAFTDPRGAYGETYATVKVLDVSISTSGDYEKYYKIDEVRYSHLLNPFTGSPIQTGIMSATVIGGTAAEGDALTTALTAMGRDKAISFINQNLKDYKVVFSYESVNGTQVISNFAGLNLSNAEYQIKSQIDENGNIIYTGNAEEDVPVIPNKSGCNSSIVGGESVLIISLTLTVIACVIAKKGKRCQ